MHLPLCKQGDNPLYHPVAELGEDGGHRVLRVVRKGARKAKIPLPPAMVAALDAYMAARGERAGVRQSRQLNGAARIRLGLRRKS